MSNRTFSTLLSFLGFASILASIAIWFTQGGTEKTHEDRSHGERFGIFVGLWAPTFFILSNKFHEAALVKDET